MQMVPDLFFNALLTEENLMKTFASALLFGYPALGIASIAVILLGGNLDLSLALLASSAACALSCVYLALQDGAE
jgi:hypothetical protein